MEQIENTQERLLGFLIDVNKGTAEPLFFYDDLPTFYKLLNCNAIDIQAGTLDGIVFDFIIDDESIIKNNPKPSAFTKDDKPCFAGNILICHADDETGKQTGLTENDIKVIYNHIVNVVNTDDPNAPTFKAIKDIEF